MNITRPVLTPAALVSPQSLANAFQKAIETAQPADFDALVGDFRMLSTTLGPSSPSWMRLDALRDMPEILRSQEFTPLIEVLGALSLEEMDSLRAAIALEKGASDVFRDVKSLGTDPASGDRTAIRFLAAQAAGDPVHVIPALARLADRDYGLASDVLKRYNKSSLPLLGTDPYGVTADMVGPLYDLARHGNEIARGKLIDIPLSVYEDALNTDGAVISPAWKALYWYAYRGRKEQSTPLQRDYKDQTVKLLQRPDLVDRIVGEAGSCLDAVDVLVELSGVDHLAWFRLPQARAALQTIDVESLEQAATSHVWDTRRHAQYLLKTLADELEHAGARAVLARLKPSERGDIAEYELRYIAQQFGRSPVAAWGESVVAQIAEAVGEQPSLAKHLSTLYRWGSHGEALDALTKGAIQGYSTAAKQLGKLVRDLTTEDKEFSAPLAGLLEAARHHYVALEALVDFYAGEGVNRWETERFRSRFPKAGLQLFLECLSFSDLQGRPSKNLRETLVSKYGITHMFQGGTEALTTKIAAAIQEISSLDESVAITAIHELQDLGVAARDAVPHLRALLVNDHASWRTKGSVVWALEDIAAKDDAETAMVLASVSRPSDGDAPDYAFRYHATRVMLDMEAPVVIPTLITILENRGEYYRVGGSSWMPKAAAERLAKFGSLAHGAVPILMEIAAKPMQWGTDIRIAAVNALEAIGDGSEQVISVLIPLLNPVRFEDLIRSYDQNRQPGGPLRQSGRWTPTEGRGTAASAFAYTWSNWHKEEADARDALRVAATRALVRLGRGNEAAETALAKALDDYDPSVIRAAQGQE